MKGGGLAWSCRSHVIVWGERSTGRWIVLVRAHEETWDRSSRARRDGPSCPSATAMARARARRRGAWDALRPCWTGLMPLAKATWNVVVLPAARAAPGARRTRVGQALARRHAAGVSRRLGAAPLRATKSSRLAFDLCGQTAPQSLAHVAGRSASKLRRMKAGQCQRQPVARWNVTGTLPHPLRPWACRQPLVSSRVCLHAWLSWARQRAESKPSPRAFSTKRAFCPSQSVQGSVPSQAPGASLQAWSARAWARGWRANARDQAQCTHAPFLRTERALQHGVLAGHTLRAAPSGRLKNCALAHQPCWTPELSCEYPSVDPLTRAAA